jgi:hypothetical protein
MAHANSQTRQHNRTPPELWAALAGHAPVEQKFSMTAMVAAYQGTYDKLLHRTGASASKALTGIPMCGITGIFDTRGKRDIDRAVLHRMNEAQFHRGPDEGGLHIEPGVGLGHRRLSIIDSLHRPAAAL